MGLSGTAWPNYPGKIPEIQATLALERTMRENMLADRASVDLSAQLPDKSLLSESHLSELPGIIPGRLTFKRLRELFHYDPETGVFTRATRVSGHKIGDVAGSMTAKGYRQIGVDGRVYLSHRLAWLYMTGEWPADEIDHRDGNPANNRFDNLREATHAENQQNRAPPKTSSSGLIGATWYSRSGRWLASICAGGRQIHLGLFDTPEEAHAAYLSAKARLHQFQPVALRPTTALPMGVAS